ncbi:MAG: efflux RND transporter periplasmic adaptor subunit [Deltaproteobacteria bacterium]|nr:efflux RND transporter periplasmic adaptor subunit [Deltaproteobacteria bacterium]
MRSSPALLLLASLSLTACPAKETKPAGGRGPGGPGGMQGNTGRVVEVERPQRGPFTVSGQYPGEFVSDAAARLNSEVAGTVRSLEARLGDRVEKGQVLATVDAFDYRSRVQELEAEIAVGEAQVEQARVQARNLEAELERKSPLLQRQLITEREIEDLQAKVSAAHQAEAIARSSVERSRVRARSASQDLFDTRIRAPFAGVIAERHVDIGSQVGPSTPVFDLVDLDAIYFRLRVPERDSGQVEVGRPVTVRVEALGGRQVEGAVSRIAPALDPSTRTLRVDVGPTPGGGAVWSGVKPGMYGQARLRLGEREDALTLSLPSVLRDRDGRRFVFVVEDGKARRLDVQPGLASEERIEILGDFPADAAVVRRGAEQLRDGTEVSTVDTEAKASP